METKKVLVVCGLGVATSTVVALAIEEEMKKRGLQVYTIQCKASEVFKHVDDVDLIVATTPVAGKYPVPVIHTLAFITGVGKEEVIEKIAQALN